MINHIQRLKEIRSELFDIANSYAGNETGVVAGNLHNCGNEVFKCIRMLEKGITPEDETRLMVHWYSNHPELLKILSE